MQLHPGRVDEYQRRHDEIDGELTALLKAAGISEYFIFLDEETNALFATLDVDDPAALEELPKHPVMKRWWAHMKDIMDTNADNSPVSTPLTQVFHMR